MQIRMMTKNRATTQETYSFWFQGEISAEEALSKACMRGIELIYACLNISVTKVEKRHKINYLRFVNFGQLQ